MRLMTGRAALQPHRRVFKREGPALIAMALEAARLIGRNHPHRSRRKAPMRIVAIHAGHGAFGKPMLVGPLELRPDVSMTARALLVDRRKFSGIRLTGCVLVSG